MKFECIFDRVADYDQTFKLINRGYSSGERFAGQWFETTAEIFEHFLNILPPLDMTGTGDAFSMCEFATGFLTDAFLRVDGRFYYLSIHRERSTDFTNVIREFRAELAREAA